MIAILLIRNVFLREKFIKPKKIFKILVINKLDNLINNMSLVFIDLYFLSTFEILSPKFKRFIFLILTSLPKL